MLNRLGIETRLQLAITICVVSLVIVTTIGSGGPPWVFFTYRSLLLAIAVLSAIGSRRADFRISRTFLALTILLFSLMLVSVLRIEGSHFDGFYLWFKYAFFAAAFINLAHYARYQTARWRGLLLAVIVATCLAHLLPDLIRNQGLVKGFSPNNANYFASFLLIGLSISIAGAVFALLPKWRIAALMSAGIILVGIVKTSSRGATLAALAMIVVAGFRARGRIPRQVWLGAGLAGMLAAMIASPYMIRKFIDRGEIDPYNYARREIWQSSLSVIGQSPVLGVGFGQFFHISKRFTLPVQGPVARYMKRAQMAHNEYLQHLAELGIPAALTLFSMFGYLLYQVAKRARNAWPDFRCFNETVLLTAAGVGVHALVDNCWTIPVTASSLVVLALADPLPLKRKDRHSAWTTPKAAAAGVALAGVYALSAIIPAIGLYLNDVGHRAYDRDDFAAAERYHLAAIAVFPDHPLFLDNLGMVYLQQFTENKDPNLLASAKEYFRRAIVASPQALDPHVHMEAVLVRSLDGDPGHDRSIYEEIVQVNVDLLRIDPFIPFTRKNLGGAYYNLGDVEHAMLELQQAIEYEPNYVPGHLQMSEWYKERGDEETSRRHYMAALGIIHKYRNFKPTQPYEGVLLARPQDPPSASAEQKR